MEFSARIRKEAKSYNVKPDWLVMADLRSIGYTDAEAYSIVHPEADMFGAGNAASLRDSIMKKAAFRDLVDARISLLRSGKAAATGDKSSIDLISAEQVAKELLNTAMTLPEGTKERADILIKYADLVRKNTDVDVQKDSDNGVRVYLPNKCYMCVALEEYEMRLKAQSAKNAAKEQDDDAGNEDNGSENEEITEK